MEPVVFMFYLGIPLCSGLLQFFVTRSRLPLGKKYIPLAVVCLTAALTWGASFGYVPLPETFFFDPGGFFPMPDYIFVGLCCIPALFGIMLGAIFGVAHPGRRDEP